MFRVSKRISCIHKTAILIKKKGGGSSFKNSEGEEKLSLVGVNKMKMETESNEMNAREGNAAWNSVNVFTKASMTNRSEIHSKGFATLRTNKSRNICGE